MIPRYENSLPGYAETNPPPYSPLPEPVSNQRPAQEAPPLPRRPNQANAVAVSVPPQSPSIRTLHFYRSRLPPKGKIKDSDRATTLYRWRIEKDVWQGETLALYAGSLFVYHRKIGSIGILRFDVHGQRTIIKRYPERGLQCLYTTSKANPSLGELKWFIISGLYEVKLELRNSQGVLLARHKRTRFAWKKTGKLEIMPALGTDTTVGLLDEMAASGMALWLWIAMLDYEQKRAPLR